MTINVLVIEDGGDNDNDVIKQKWPDSEYEDSVDYNINFDSAG